MVSSTSGMTGTDSRSGSSVFGTDSGGGGVAFTTGMDCVPLVPARLWRRRANGMPRLVELRVVLVIVLKLLLLVLGRVG